MSNWTAKRFWTSATVGEAEGGFEVLLDGRPVRTPAKAPLVVPTRAMAAAIAAEWDAQAEKIDPETMPVTRSANAAIDKVTVQHSEVAEMLAAYGDSDLLCYRATDPAELVARQAAAWDPLLEWAASALGAPLAARTGVMHRPQPAEALVALGRRVHALDAFSLAAFHDLVSISGSLILAFAVANERLTPAEAWEISRIDETWQEELWGEDEEAVAAAARKRAAFLTAAEILFMLRLR